jgi:hypothetical protein
MQPEQILVPGQGAQNGVTRWGDYTSLSIDPLDDCTFWYVNEYYRKTSMSNWRTAIGTFAFPECINGRPATPTPTPTPTPSAAASQP